MIKQFYNSLFQFVASALAIAAVNADAEAAAHPVAKADAKPEATPYYGWGGYGGYYGKRSAEATPYYGWGGYGGYRYGK